MNINNDQSKHSNQGNSRTNLFLSDLDHCSFESLIFVTEAIEKLLSRVFKISLSRELEARLAPFSSETCLETLNQIAKLGIINHDPGEKSSENWQMCSEIVFLKLIIYRVHQSLILAQEEN